jgi:hypothetical protein
MLPAALETTIERLVDEHRFKQALESGRRPIRRQGDGIRATRLELISVEIRPLYLAAVIRSTVVGRRAA